MEQLLEKFKALSDETRLRIINLFIKSGKNLCVCELTDALQLPQYAVSKALTVMKNAGLFSTAKEGTWVYYILNKDSQENKNLFNYLKTNLNMKILKEDEERLGKRLLLREKDKCVVGIIPEEELLKLIREKSDE